jgi:hypothetical protein
MSEQNLNSPDFRSAATAAAGTAAMAGALKGKPLAARTAEHST